MAPSQPLIFRKGLDMKDAVAGELAAAYHSAIVDRVRGQRLPLRHRPRSRSISRASSGSATASTARWTTPIRPAAASPAGNVFLTGEIIHNPHVNDQLRAADIRFLSDPGERWETLGPDDVVILPAFGVTVGDMARLVNQGCTLVDTTCGSVLNVWKNVVRYAQDGFTAIIHGKVHHEETRATASQALKYPRGRYLVVLDRAEAGGGLRLHPTGSGADSAAFMARFGAVASPGFDPGRRSGPGRLRQPDDDADVGIAGDRGDVPGGDDGALWRGRPRGALPRLRHDLQRDAGAAGRRHRAARRASGWI